MSLSLTVTFAPILPDLTNLSSPQESISIPFVTTAAKGTKYNKSIATSDSSFALESVGTIGYVRIKNLAQAVVVSTPDLPVISPQGTPGAATWTYKIVALQSDGTYSAASAAGSTATGNATLTGSNYNQIDWTAITGATSYAVYRTVSGGTPSTLGLIGTVTAGVVTFNDTGMAGDTTTAPATAADNLLLIGHTSGTYVLSLKGGELNVFRWNSAALHHKSNTRIVPCEITILDD